VDFIRSGFKTPSKRSRLPYPPSNFALEIINPYFCGCGKIRIDAFSFLTRAIHFLNKIIFGFNGGLAVYAFLISESSNQWDCWEKFFKSI
jgi:hypothetical protein